MWRMYVSTCAWAVVWSCMRSRVEIDAILQTKLELTFI